MHKPAPLLTVLLLLLLSGCPPQLHNGNDDDDSSSAEDDDDDTTGGDDVCCDGDDGTGTTWEQCDNRDAVECVCNSDDWCCGSGWDGGCTALYLSPCGATCP
jgi:hypothetical protein